MKANSLGAWSLCRASTRRLTPLYALGGQRPGSSSKISSSTHIQAAVIFVLGEGCA